MSLFAFLLLDSRQLTASNSFSLFFEGNTIVFTLGSMYTTRCQCMDAKHTCIMYQFILQGCTQFNLLSSMLPNKYPISILLYNPVIYPLSSLLYNPVNCPLSSSLYNTVNYPLSSPLYNPVNCPLSSPLYNPVNCPLSRAIKNHVNGTI